MGGLSHREATLKAGFLTAVALVRVLVIYIELDQSSISVICSLLQHCCKAVVGCFCTCAVMLPCV